MSQEQIQQDTQIEDTQIEDSQIEDSQIQHDSQIEDTQIESVVENEISMDDKEHDQIGGSSELKRDRDEDDQKIAPSPKRQKIEVVDGEVIVCETVPTSENAAEETVAVCETVSEEVSVALTEEPIAKDLIAEIETNDVPRIEITVEESQQ